jgi:hypothetical protein
MDEGEINMTNYEKHLEKVWRDGMVVGDIYNFIGKGTGGWRYRYTLIGFEGCGEDLLLIFKSAEHDTVFRIMANDIGAAHLFSKPTEYKKEETNMNNFDEMLEKKWRERMIVGQKYDVIRKGENDRTLRLTFLRSYGHGLDFTLAFEYSNHERLDIKAWDIVWVYPLSFPDALPKPMELVKKSEEYKFDEKAFYRATNGVRHFVLKDSDNNRYEALYYEPILDGAGMHIAFASNVGCDDVTVQSAKLYHDKILYDAVCVWTDFKLFKGDSVYTLDEIKISDIFKKEEKLEWDIDKLKVGKAYCIRDIDGNETDGIYRFLYEPTIPGQSSIVFAVVSDKGVVGTCHVYQEDLVSGKIKIYELACRKEIDEE